MNKDEIIIFEDKNARKGWGYLSPCYTEEELWDKIRQFLNDNNGKYDNHIIKHWYSDMKGVNITESMISGDGSPVEYRIYAILYWEPK